MFRFRLYPPNLNDLQNLLEYRKHIKDNFYITIRKIFKKVHDSFISKLHLLIKEPILNLSIMEFHQQF